MRGGDTRSARMAILAEYLVNPDAPENVGLGAPPPVRELLESLGYGLVFLPPHDFPDAGMNERVEYLVDDAVEYRANGYEVVVVGVDGLPGNGVWLDRIERELARRGADALPRIDVPLWTTAAGDELARVRAFLVESTG